MRSIVLIFIFAYTFTSSWCQEKLSPEKLYHAAETAHNSGRYKEALDLLNKCLQENPNYADAYFTRAATREQLQDLNGAHTDYSVYIELVPDSYEALLSRGVVRYRMDRYEQAKEDFIKLLRLPPGETNTIYYQKSPSVNGTRQIMTAQGSLKPQLFNYLGLAEMKLKNFQLAKAWLDSAIRMERAVADYYVNRGIIKEAMNDTSAFSDYRKALTINPAHTIALHNIAVLKRKTGDTSDQGDLEKAIESDSSMLYPYVERAYQRLEGGYYKGALEDYNKALTIEDKDPDIWLNRGLVKEKLNDLKGAYADYSQAIGLKENFAKAWLNRGNVLSKLGKYKEAVEDYTVAITYEDNYPSAYYNRSIAKERLKKYSEACEDLKKAETLGAKVNLKLKEKVCAN